MLSLRRVAQMAVALLAIGVTVAIALSAGETLAGSPRAKLCHIPPGNPHNPYVIEVSHDAVTAHLAHGDFLGASCEPTETPTNTPVPPTDTPTPVPPTDTPTPVPPTDTPTPVPPTDTPTPVPPTDTPTPVPPTDTPTPDA